MTDLFNFFKFNEMIKSDTADKLKIDNTPNDDVVIANIMYTLRCLDTIREEFGQPIYISSGYRCYELNRAVRGSKTSQHCFGEAADIYTKGDKNNKDLYNLIKSKFRFDQLINEKPDRNGVPSWVHVSFVNDVTANRGECLIFKNGRYYRDK